MHEPGACGSSREPASRYRWTVNIIKVVIAGIFFLGSWALFGYAVYAPDGWQAVTFFAGIISMALAFALPLNVFSRS